MYRFQECGHEQQIQPSLVRLLRFECRTCFEERLESEAQDAGLILLGSAKRNAYYRYQFVGCGHHQEISTQAVRLKNFRCQTCEEYAFTLPADAYLLHIKVGPDEWL
jgi:hypothetical protein